MKKLLFAQILFLGLFLQSVCFGAAVLPANMSDGNPLPAANLNQMLAERDGDFLPISSSASNREYQDDAQDIGSPTYKWAEGYFSQTVYAPSLNMTNHHIESFAHSMVFKGLPHAHQTFYFQPSSNGTAATNASIYLRKCVTRNEYETQVILSSKDNIDNYFAQTMRCSENFILSGYIVAGGFKVPLAGYGLSVDTADGSDDGYINLLGGGYAARTRGAWVQLYGNEYTADAYKGAIRYIPGLGDNANHVGRHLFYNANGVLIATGGKEWEKTSKDWKFYGDTTVSGDLTVSKSITAVTMNADTFILTTANTYYYSFSAGNTVHHSNSNIGTPTVNLGWNYWGSIGSSVASDVTFETHLQLPCRADIVSVNLFFDGANTDGSYVWGLHYHKMSTQLGGLSGLNPVGSIASGSGDSEAGYFGSIDTSCSNSVVTNNTYSYWIHVEINFSGTDIGELKYIGGILAYTRDKL